MALLARCISLTFSVAIQGDMKPLNAISKLLSLTGLVPPRAFGEV